MTSQRPPQDRIWASASVNTSLFVQGPMCVCVCLKKGSVGASPQTQTLRPSCRSRWRAGGTRHTCACVGTESLDSSCSADRTHTDTVWEVCRTDRDLIKMFWLQNTTAVSDKWNSETKVPMVSHLLYSCGYGDEYHVWISYFPNSMTAGQRMWGSRGPVAPTFYRQEDGDGLHAINIPHLTVTRLLNET